MRLQNKHLRAVSVGLEASWNQDETTSRERAARERGRRPRLLVVDDEESICFALSEYFSLQGFNVDTARELGEAARLIDSWNYEVIIQDLRLGATLKPDGLCIVSLAHKLHPETRIIVLTAYGSAEIEDEAKRCGAKAFLRKPLPLSQVAQVVQVLMESPVQQSVRPA